MQKGQYNDRKIESLIVFSDPSFSLSPFRSLLLFSFARIQMIDSRSDGLIPFLLLRSLTWERSGQVFKAVQDVERALEEEDSLQVS